MTAPLPDAGTGTDPTRGRINRYNIPPTATTITAFRPLRNGTGRQYSGTTWPDDPWGGIEHAVRTGMKLGFLRECADADPANDYAVLDVLDDNDDIVRDFTITTARAFRWFKKRYGWTVQRDEAEEDEDARGQHRAGGA